MYTFKLEDCDVVDRNKLRDYRNKREEWVARFKADDHHALWRQINRILWDYAFFSDSK